MRNLSGKYVYQGKSWPGKQFIGTRLLMMHSSWLSSVQVAALETISSG